MQKFARLPFIYEPKGVLTFCKALSGTPHIKIFNTEIVKVHLDMIWEQLFFKLIAASFIPYVIFVVFICYFYIYELQQRISADERLYLKMEVNERITGFGWFTLIYSLTYCVIQMIFEVK